MPHIVNAGLLLHECGRKAQIYGTLHLVGLAANCNVDWLLLCTQEYKHITCHIPYVKCHNDCVDKYCEFPGSKAVGTALREQLLVADFFNAAPAPSAMCEGMMKH